MSALVQLSIQSSSTLGQSAMSPRAESTIMKSELPFLVPSFNVEMFDSWKVSTMLVNPQRVSAQVGALN